MTSGTVWEHGRLDARRGPKRVLFGRMYEDADVERISFPVGGRVFAIASAGCTAIALCRAHEVVACDINPEQLAYAERRFAGAPAEIGTAEKVMGLGRGLMPLAGWREAVVREFLALEDPAAQLAYWREHLDTWLFRAGLDALLSVTSLRAVYASPLLACLPAHFGAVMRGRMERAFARHPNASNAYARALLLGEPATDAVPDEARRIRPVLSDAASYLESCPERSFGGFALSNILDGAEPAYAERLFAAVKRAAAPDAIVVLRSFSEPGDGLRTNRVDEDRSMLWGVVDVRPAAEL